MQLALWIWATSDSSWPLEALNLSSREVEVITRSWLRALWEKVTILAVSSAGLGVAVVEWWVDMGVMSSRRTYSVNLKSLRLSRQCAEFTSLVLYIRCCYIMSTVKKKIGKGKVK